MVGGVCILECHKNGTIYILSIASGHCFWRVIKSKGIAVPKTPTKNLIVCI